MILAFAARLGLFTSLTGIVEQKIDGSALKTYGIAILGFLIQDMSGRIQFFLRNFLVS